MTSILNVQNSLENLIKYLKPYLPLVNSHMVSYLTDDHWKSYIPESIQEEIKSQSDINQSIEEFWEFKVKSEKLTNLGKFVENSENLLIENLKNISINVEELKIKLKSLNCSLPSGLSLEISEFMSSKKNHEVIETASIVSSLSTYKSKHLNDRMFIIDAGDGKGYLSSRLALEHGLKVLGVDSSSINTVGAEKRNSKLEKKWNGLTRRAEIIKSGQVPEKHGKKKIISVDSVPKNQFDDKKYKTTTQFITFKTDLIGLVKENFPDDDYNKFCLSGLHTCGNLASDSLKIFVNNPSVICLCNIGCCYHLLKEEFIDDTFFLNKKVEDSPSEYGFPLSEFLRKQQFCLGRNARMLAAQSIYRTVLSKELPNKTLFFRALLEKLIVDKLSDNSHTKQVGKIKCENFIEYIRKCSKKSNLNFENISDEELQDLYKKYEFQGNLLNLFYLFRMTFSSILEVIILLDRILFLNENLIENVFLVDLFDPVISPRRFGVIGLK